MNATDWLYRVQTHIETLLENLLQQASGPSVDLENALRYAVMGGGKRLRPALIYALAEPFNLEFAILDAPALAIELTHNYSLIHDDLPSMDDDSLRHGRPTLHKAFNEAIAILAGDALQALAFETLANQQAPHALAQISCLAQAAGRQGMVGGQSLDLAAINQTLELPALQRLHQHKTGALIAATLEMAGLIKFQADDQRLTHLRLAGQALGLAFQIRDDVLDVISSQQQLGKTPYKDQQTNKPTYVSMLSITEADRHARQLLHEANQHIQSVFITPPQILLDLMQFMIDRHY